MLEEDQKALVEHRDPGDEIQERHLANPNTSEVLSIHLVEPSKT